MHNAHIGRLVLVGLALLAAWLGQGLLLADAAAPAEAQSPFGAALLALGAVLFVGVSLWAWRDGQGGRAEGLPARVQALIDRMPPGYGLLALSLVCAGASFRIAFQPGVDGWPALVTWLAGIALFLAATRHLPASAAEAADEVQAPPYARWERWALAVLTLAALLVRAWSLAEIPANFGGDEGEMGVAARNVLYGLERRPFVTGWLSHPMLWFYLQAGALLVFGDSVFGLRMLSALLGAAAVPALYVFARPLYGRAVALTAAGLLAAYHFHIHFSRLGANNITDPLLALVAYAAFLRGYQRGSLPAFALAGVLLGVSMHFYMGARLAPLVVAGVLLHQLLLVPARVWRLRWHVATLVAGFVLGFGPLLLFFINHPEDFTARLAMVGVFQSGWFGQQLLAGRSPAAILAEQAARGFGAYTYFPDRSAWYDPKMPLLDHTSATLFLLGMALTAARFRRPDSALLLGWVAGASVFGGMLIVNLESPRFVTTAPALCLLIALALHQIAALLGWTLGTPQHARAAIAAAGVVLLAAWNLNFYFREYTPRATYGWVTTEAATAIGAYLRAQPAGTYAYMFGPPRLYLGNGTVRFMAPQAQGVDMPPEPITSPDQLPLPPEGARPVFIFLPERLAELEVVRRRYPEGRLEHRPARGEPGTLFTIFEPALKR
ncbi:MAG TPA: glycosyltransferase family 39 protein [Roseiflexaceae bacterium]|nr:glycosyltransferase family 39 protein [Roseiflexaceae bacterium]